MDKMTKWKIIYVPITKTLDTVHVCYNPQFIRQMCQLLQSFYLIFPRFKQRDLIEVFIKVCFLLLTLVLTQQSLIGSPFASSKDHFIEIKSVVKSQLDLLDMRSCKNTTVNHKKIYFSNIFTAIIETFL